jgi:type IV pilus assembly protein PilB
MPVKTGDLKTVLLSSRIVDEKKLAEAEKQAQAEKIPLEAYLVAKKILTEDKLAELRSSFFGVPAVDLRKMQIPKDILLLIPEPIARRHQVVAFGKKGKDLELAMLDPTDLQIREFIKKKTGLATKPYLATDSGLDFALSQYHTSLQAEFEKIMEHEAPSVHAEKQAETTQQELAKMAEEIPVVRVVDTLLEYAIFEKASDVHVEPQENEVVVRYRIDGILHDVMTLPKVILPALVARIKVLSNLKIDEHRLPQDGRFKVQNADEKISLRVSTIPVFDGEKVVMRILHESGEKLTLEDIGLTSRNLEVVQRNLKKPHGMLLVTGPTGSGKSTTLYAVLTMLNTKSVNISTIEDPIEYRIPGVNQMQVSPKIGLTFAVGLRALLRQDPNIIMIGEIRDRETAEEAVHAAMTGHIVLSTLHTNSAAGALPRLLDIGVESFLIASTVNSVLGQRLVRKICPDCKEAYTLEKETIATLSQTFDLKSVMEVLKQEGIAEKGTSDITDLKFWRGKGCSTCNDSGYKGRVGIFEVLEITDAVGKMITTREPAPRIQEQGQKEGMILMWQDGIIKCVQGITTIQEVLRVTKE